MTVSSDGPGVLEISGLTTDAIGDRAAAEGLTLHELSSRQASLEDAFMELTRDAVELRDVPRRRVAIETAR